MLKYKYSPDKPAMSQQTIQITIDGKTHEFKVGDTQAIKDLAWQDRKQLIELLEHIKQAEYVKKSTAPTEPEEPLNQPVIAAKPTMQSQPKSNDPKMGIDAEVKPGQGDVDSIMSRLILEEKKHQTTIPDRGAAIKWILIAFGIIILIALLF